MISILGIGEVYVYHIQTLLNDWSDHFDSLVSAYIHDHIAESSLKFTRGKI